MSQPEQSTQRANAGRFWTNVGTALSGVVLAQAIPLLGSLAIARLYAPADFGLYATWLGVVTMLSVILTGRFDMTLAIVATGRPRAVAVCGTLSTCVLGALALAAAGLPLVWLAPGLMRPLTIPLALLTIPAALGFAASKTWQSWAAASGQLRVLSTMRICQAAVITATQIIVGWFLPSALGMAGSFLFGVAASVLMSSRLMPLPLREFDGIRDFRHAVRAYWRANYRFPLLALPADAISACAAMLPLILLANRFGAEVSGLLALAIRVLGAPISLLGTAVLDVFWRTSGESFRERGHCRDDYLRTFKVLSAGAAAVSIVIVAFSEPLFVLAFGEKWREAGRIAAWLMPMFALSFVASPLSFVFYVADKQHVDLAWQLGVLGMTLSAYLLAPSYPMAIRMYSAGYSLLYLVYLALSWRFSQGSRVTANEERVKRTGNPS
ncbi:lipopolysaccharide biosynthesis protein [Noviherbaspirillum galbum]|uniref:Lipopolysaccharide biosynthesis protein n=1 Tax=Noviherbaspirillum galbum TaxID=2709383 RepID=A0A6B3SX05_9BURK|nr:lipopolysaccharide biosynthesis protein [Noviherbaspirillum galbum]NEX64035.1 lipopolysaccharide biosynthesis protein [Noviherbaspirillum galbum]